MGNLNNDFLFVVRAAAEALERRDGKALARLRAAVGTASKTKPSGTRKAEAGPARPFLREEFANFSSREALEKHLRGEYPNKNTISPILRALRIPVIKTDQYELMVDRIVDATVGFKLRSAAVRGPQKSSGGDHDQAGGASDE